MTSSFIGVVNYKWQLKDYFGSEKNDDRRLRQFSDKTTAVMWHAAAYLYGLYWVPLFLFWIPYWLFTWPDSLFKNTFWFTWLTGLFVLSSLAAVPVDQYEYFLWTPMMLIFILSWIVTLYMRGSILDFIETQKLFDEQPQLKDIAEGK